jgi:hypothetical protein
MMILILYNKDNHNVNGSADSVNIMLLISVVIMVLLTVWTLCYSLVFW